MMKTDKTTHLPSIKRTVLRCLGIVLWLLALTIASTNGFFVHTLLGTVLLVVLTYLTYQRIIAKASELRKKREQYIDNYQVGEKYLSVFFVED